MKNLKNNLVFNNYVIDIGSPNIYICEKDISKIFI